MLWGSYVGTARNPIGSIRSGLRPVNTPNTDTTKVTTTETSHILSIEVEPINYILYFHQKLCSLCHDVVEEQSRENSLLYYCTNTLAMYYEVDNRAVITILLYSI